MPMMTGLAARARRAAGRRDGAARPQGGVP